MAKLSKENSAGTLHPRENAVWSGSGSALGGEFQIDTHGNTTAMLALSGTFVATLDLEGTVDGINWVSIAMLPYNARGSHQFGASASGLYWANVAGFQSLKVKITSYTSGTVSATLTATTGVCDVPDSADQVVSVTSASGQALTVTLPAAANLTHHITQVQIERYAATALLASATPTTVTTTNLPNGLSWTIPREAAAQGSVYDKEIAFTHSLRAVADGTATTFTLPATPSVIWRVNVYYFLAP